MKRLKTWKKIRQSFFQVSQKLYNQFKVCKELQKRYGLSMQWGRNSCLQITE